MQPVNPTDRTTAPGASGARFKRYAVVAIATAAALFLALSVVVYAITYHPLPVEMAAVAGPSDTAVLQPGQTIKVMSWNVQYMAGKEHLFWYDAPPHYAGPVDTRPSPDDIARTLKAVAGMIIQENPDIVLLQEVDDGSKRTDYANQLARLLELLPPLYRQQTEAFYHREKFVPEPHILGAVGMKLAILSKYRIATAIRHQLPRMPKDLLTRQFYFKRAVLEAHFPMQGGRDFVLLNTHFDAWAAGTGTAEKQVAAVCSLLERLNRQGVEWCLGGDFNSLAPGPAYDRLPESERWEFEQHSALTPLFDQYQAVPSRTEIAGDDFARWHSHWKNGLPAPDKTIDFIFTSTALRLGPHRICQHRPGTEEYLRISDHFPVIAEITLPPN